MLKVIITALVAVFLCLNFASANSYVVFGGLSKHTTSKAPNEFHRTTMVIHNEWFAGYFRNSFNDDSFAIGKTFTSRKQVMDVVLNAGVVYGYRKSSKCYKTQHPTSNDPKIICPLLAPEVILKQLPLKPSISWYGLDALVLNFRIEF